MSVVVFDLGNVLADHDGKVEALAEVWGVDAGDLAGPYWAHRASYDAGCDDFTYFAALADDLNLPMSAELAADLALTDARHWAQIRPSAQQLLAELHRAAVPTAILSNAPATMLTAIEEAPWRGLVGGVIVSGVVQQMKPDAEIYRSTEAALERPGTELLFIDDRDENVRGAQLCGWTAHLWVDDHDSRAWLESLGLLRAPGDSPTTGVSTADEAASPPVTLSQSAPDSPHPELAFRPETLDAAEQTADTSPAEAFTALACLRYDHLDAPPRWQRAEQLLATHPALITETIWAAAAAGNLSAVRAHLATDPTLASRRGGPQHWEPLLHLCYSRVASSDSAAEVAAALIEAGANPNAAFLWDGTYLFTALTGVFGEGEQGNRRQPRHPQERELAVALLQRGAHPYDPQTLYNRMFRSDDSHFEVLFSHGLASCGEHPWSPALGELVESPEQAWGRQVHWAADHGFGHRLTLLASHGIDTSGVTLAVDELPADVNALDQDGATALHRAAWAGEVTRITTLLALGADPTIVEPRFGATALGWAEHAYQTEAAEVLRRAGNSG